MKKHPAFLAEMPARPAHRPVAEAIERSMDRPQVAGVLKLFASMPPSTGVFANPAGHHQQLPCGDAAVDVDVREFNIRGLLREADIVAGDADAVRVMFVGLFSRAPTPAEERGLRRLIGRAFEAAFGSPLTEIAGFMKRFPQAAPEIAMQYGAACRKAARGSGSLNPRRSADTILLEMVNIHMENVAVAAAASFMRHLLQQKERRSAPELCRHTRRLAEGCGGDAFETVFALLLRRPARPQEAGILGQLGAIQVHHGSAGSNMVARYLASLHTRAISDLFTAAQMTLDCGRHFGAISDLTDFVRELERLPRKRRDEAIRTRIRSGNLPTFGHPEISAAGRSGNIEMDPRPALYLSPLFKAIDAGEVTVSAAIARRAGLLERMYQIALVEGVEKGSGRLRLTPNTDFGAWLVQETLGIEEPDRTLLSYAYRGFGWMMDAREQLQQPIIRPVIPPDPALTTVKAEPGTARNPIPDIIALVHRRLMNGDAVTKQP